MPRLSRSGGWGLSAFGADGCLKRFVAREVYRALISTPITQASLAPAACKHWSI